MKVKKEVKKTIEITTCDFCGKDNISEYYYKCDICGKDFCSDCKPSLEENYTHLCLCKNCVEPMKDFMFEYVANQKLEDLRNEEINEKECEVITQIRKEYGYTYKTEWEKLW